MLEIQQEIIHNQSPRRGGRAVTYAGTLDTRRLRRASSGFFFAIPKIRKLCSRRSPPPLPTKRSSFSCSGARSSHGADKKISLPPPATPAGCQAPLHLTRGAGRSSGRRRRATPARSGPAHWPARCALSLAFPSLFLSLSLRKALAALAPSCAEQRKA
jgi:hypothetical protein